MKILWFTNVVLPEAAVKLNLPVCHKAGWLEGYLSALREIDEVSVSIITRCGAINHTKEVMVDGVMHIVLPCTAVDVTALLTPHGIKEYRTVIQSVSPDLIHYHGSEYHYGLLTADNHIQIPAVLSAQGLLTECERGYFGGLSFREIIRSHTLFEVYHRGGIWGGWRQFVRRAIIEKKIIQGMHHVIGRTRWDRAHVGEMNPLAKYYYCDELLRPAFYQKQRQLETVQRYSIFSPTASYPLKGFHVLLKAVSLLKDDFPNIKIRIADSQTIQAGVTDGYYRFLYGLIQKLNLSNSIEWLGPLNDVGMANALAISHIYSMPSIIENSSNGLAEAMLVGVPSVVSLAGGLTTMVIDKSTALCFPAGDHAMLAECIRMLFSNDALAQRIAGNAQVVARHRHDSNSVGQNLLAIYHSIVNGIPISRNH